MHRNTTHAKTLFLCRAALIAALYTVLTLLSAAMGLSSGVIQIRFSEMLCILPMFTPAAIPGIAIGCLCSNLITGAIWQDIVFGTLASLIGAYGTYALRRFKWLAPIPPILSNTIIVPLVLIYAYGVSDALPYLMLTVGIGEVISAGLLGMILLKSLEKHKDIF